MVSVPSVPPKARLGHETPQEIARENSHTAQKDEKKPGPKGPAGPDEQVLACRYGQGETGPGPEQQMLQPLDDHIEERGPKPVMAPTTTPSASHLKLRTEW
jgi:hypothetical protein